MRVALLASTARNGTHFYDLLADLMQVAAPQLDIELEILTDGTHERDDFIRAGREVLARATRPDYLILANVMGIASELVPEFDKAGVPTLVLTDGLSPSDRLSLRRRGCSRFLGEIVPDDAEAGRMLAELLVAEARTRGLQERDGRVHVSVLSGIHTMVSNLRFRGMTAFKDGDPSVVLDSVEFGGWLEHEAAEAATMLLRRAPQTNVIWCFNDSQALGAAEAAAAMKREPGKDVLIGGVDLLDDALAAILSGRIHVSLGGHIVDGVRALLLLQAHQARSDLQPETRMMRLEAVTAADAGRYLRFMKERAWRSVDFSRFSTVRHPGGAAPELSLRALVAG